MERIRPGSEEDEWDEEVEVNIGPVLEKTIQEMTRSVGWPVNRDLESGMTAVSASIDSNL